MDTEKIRLHLQLTSHHLDTDLRSGYTLAEIIVEIYYEMDASDSFHTRSEKHCLRKVVAKRKFVWDPNSYEGDKDADQAAREWAAEGVQATFAAFFASDVEEDR